MGSKHEKKRYFVVKYNIKPDGKFDESVVASSEERPLSKKAEDAKAWANLQK